MSGVSSRGAGRWKAKQSNPQELISCAGVSDSAGAAADVKPDRNCDSSRSEVGASACCKAAPSDLETGDVALWAERQIAEVEALRAVFFESDAVCVDDVSMGALARAASAEYVLSPLAPLALSVLVGSGHGAVGARWRGGLWLSAVLPCGYPLDGCDNVVFWLEPDALAAGGGPLDDAAFDARWQEASAELLLPGDEVLLPLAQCAADLLREWLDVEVDEASCEADDALDETLALAVFEEELAIAAQSPTGPPILGRCAMFSHHIIAPGKRQAISQWAKQLGLGGLAKIGWPGVIIVEGPECDVRAYVDALSRLRWKHFVVRGEQTMEAQANQSLDELRLIPLGFEEFGTDKMSQFAARCKDYGVEELFMIAMKIGDGKRRTGQGAELPLAVSSSPVSQRRGKHR